MCTSRPSIPEAQPVQQAPTQQDPSVSNAASASAKRNRAQAGAQSTILTSTNRQAGGDESVPLMTKTLLGQ